MQVAALNTWWHERTSIDAQIRSVEVPDGKGGIERIDGWPIRAREAAFFLNDVHGGPASYALLDFDTTSSGRSCARGAGPSSPSTQLGPRASSLRSFLNCEPAGAHAGLAEETSRTSAPQRIQV